MSRSRSVSSISPSSQPSRRSSTSAHLLLLGELTGEIVDLGVQLCDLRTDLRELLADLGELDAIEAAIAAKTTARDKYRTAFENGTMDEEDTGPRFRELRTEIEALKARRDEITDLISDEPVAPSPSNPPRSEPASNT